MGTESGGITSEGIITAAQLGALGLDPFAFLNERDPLQRTLMLKLAEEMMKQKQILDRNLAIEITNNVGKLFSK